MFYILKNETEQKSIKFKSVNEIVKYFKDTEKYKIPSYLTDQANNDLEIHFNLNGIHYTVKPSVK